MISDKMQVQVWGVRGTLPVPGKLTTKYGGNTNCYSLKIGRKHFFIFDAGSGFKALSNYIIKHFKWPLKAKIFITHPHWDHINGFPYFVPFYIKNNEFKIYGTNHPGVSLERTLCTQMDSIYFPVTFQEFSAHLTYHPITEETFWLDDVCIQSMYLVHPGRCVGYKVEYNKKTFCYATDNELYPQDSPYYNKFNYDKIVNFVSNVDFLVTDATYDDEEYLKKQNWGHSSVSRVVELAHDANVKTLCLHHHDPDQSDADIDLKLQHARHLLKLLRSKTRCIAPREGDSYLI
jgi:phosphoribosyl 1,2-cyclic phosphodiesterase